MKKMAFVPVLRTFPEAFEPALSPLVLPIAETETFAVKMFLSKNGHLKIALAAHGHTTDPPEKWAFVADMYAQRSPAGVSWWLLPHSAQLQLNGVQPLPLASLAPGDLLSLDSSWWFVSEIWEIEAGPVPAELADKQCPVCGFELQAAPVVQCPCGNWYHLEKTETPDAPDALNCFLAGPCSLCNRTHSLEPQLLPEPPEKLFDW